MAVKLKAVRRDDLSKSNTNRLRNEGAVPAVVYGNKKDPVTVAVDSIELLKTVRDEGRNAVITLDVEQGQAVDVMLHDYQTDPIKEQLTHADFYVVDMSQEMDVSVSIYLDGEAVGAKEGGVLQQPLYELLIRAKPADIPEVIRINVSELGVGDAIVVSDLKEAENYQVLDDPDTTIVTVTAPDAEEDLEPAEADESAEPELVNQKGDNEEDAE